MKDYILTIDETLFDITWNVGLLLILIKPKNLLLNILTMFISARIFTEIFEDNIITWVDYLELGFIISINIFNYYKLLKK